MNRKPVVVGIGCLLATAAVPLGCAAIPREEVPVGWLLDVHQPGEWWTQPLIPRAVVVRRCPPPPGWSSEPDLTRVAGLRPGSSIEYSLLIDDYHCGVGWSQPESQVDFSPAETASEAGLRRVCSSSGLPFDESWRFLGHKPTQRVGDLPGGVEMWQLTTAAFVDDYDTVATCLVEDHGEPGAGASVELSVGGATAGGEAVCPVAPRNLARDDDGTLMEYQLRGAGAVRDAAGRVLTEASTLRIGVAGDTVTTSHPVVDGIAIVDAVIEPEVALHVDWDQPPPVEGHVYGPDGALLGTCRG